MSTPKFVKWKDVQGMLDQCAPGWSTKEKTHKRWVYWNDRHDTSLPLGPHGKRTNPDLEVGHVKNMVWTLEIDPVCATTHLGVTIRAKP